MPIRPRATAGNIKATTFVLADENWRSAATLAQQDGRPGELARDLLRLRPEHHDDADASA